MAGYRPPPFVVSRVINPLLMLFGAVPTLAVKGRRSGAWRKVPVNVLDLDGRRYLFAPRGECEWVRNLRAAGAGEIRRGARAEPFRAVELADADKAPVIAAYMSRWGAQVKGQVSDPPVPGDHPVFRLEMA